MAACAVGAIVGGVKSHRKPPKATEKPADLQGVKTRKNSE
jgi:hypothetical protein